MEDRSIVLKRLKKFRGVRQFLMAEDVQKFPAWSEPEIIRIEIVQLQTTRELAEDFRQ